MSGLDWPRDHRHSVQSVTDQVLALRAEAKSQRGEVKAAVCAVLGVALRAAEQQGSARRYQETTAIASLQTLVQSLQIRTVDLQRNLEKKKVQNDTTRLFWGTF